MKKTAAYIITFVLALTVLAGCRNNNPAATITPTHTPTSTPTHTPTATPTSTVEATTEPTEKAQESVLPEGGVLPEDGDRADVETDGETLRPQ